MAKQVSVWQDDAGKTWPTEAEADLSNAKSLFASFWSTVGWKGRALDELVEKCALHSGELLTVVTKYHQMREDVEIAQSRLQQDSYEKMV